MPREFSRRLRVAAELQKVLNELLRTEIKDPRLTDVHINEVDVSGDLGVAKVYYGTLRPGDDAEPVQRAFGKADGFLRSRASRALRLRRAPELRFIHDTSAERGIELTHLIDEADGARGRGPNGEERSGDREPDDGEPGSDDTQTGRAAGGTG